MTTTQRFALTAAIIFTALLFAVFGVLMIHWPSTAKAETSQTAVAPVPADICVVNGSMQIIDAGVSGAYRQLSYVSKNGDVVVLVYNADNTFVTSFRWAGHVHYCQ